MPKLKRYGSQEVPFSAVRRLLLGYGLNAPELASILKCSYNTAAARLERPYEFTLEELGKVARNGGIPILEIRESIKL